MKRKMLLIGVAVIGTSIAVGAATQHTISAILKQQTISYQTQTIQQEVINYEGTTYVPLRSFSELLNIPVDYRDGVIYLDEHQALSKERAEEIALGHAGVSKEEVVFIQSKLDEEDGRWVYEIDFRVGTKEYDIEIDAITGNVLSYDVEQEGYSQVTQPTGTDSFIGKEKAEEIALSHAGVARNEVGFIQNELDEDDRQWRYEIEFRKGTTEYDIEIDAYTGEVLDFSSDRD